MIRHMNGSHYPDISHAVTQYPHWKYRYRQTTIGILPSKRYTHLLFPHVYLHVPHIQNLFRSTYLHTVSAYVCTISPISFTSTFLCPNAFTQRPSCPCGYPRKLFKRVPQYWQSRPNHRINNTSLAWSHRNPKDKQFQMYVIKPTVLLYRYVVLQFCCCFTDTVVYYCEAPRPTTYIQILPIPYRSGITSNFHVIMFINVHLRTTFHTRSVNMFIN
jgi:hypothetical protein